MRIPADLHPVLPRQTYPIEPDKKGVGLDQLRERAHLRMRTEKGRAVVKTRDQVARLFRRYFEVRPVQTLFGEPATDPTVASCRSKRSSRSRRQS